jgi:hypothetical protein
MSTSYEDAVAILESARQEVIDQRQQARAASGSGMRWTGS